MSNVDIETRIENLTKSNQCPSLSTNQCCPFPIKNKLMSHQTQKQKLGHTQERQLQWHPPNKEIVHSSHHQKKRNYKEIFESTDYGEKEFVVRRNPETKYDAKAKGETKKPFQITG